MKFYHGTTVDQIPALRKSQKIAKIYATPDIERAQSYAQDRASERNSAPVLVTLIVSLDTFVDATHDNEFRMLYPRITQIEGI